MDKDTFYAILKDVKINAKGVTINLSECLVVPPRVAELIEWVDQEVEVVIRPKEQKA